MLSCASPLSPVESCGDLDRPGGAIEKRVVNSEVLPDELRAAIEKEMLGEIRLQPATDGGLWAEYRTSPGILLKGAVSGGRGDRI